MAAVGRQEWWGPLVLAYNRLSDFLLFSLQILKNNCVLPADRWSLGPVFTSSQSLDISKELNKEVRGCSGNYDACQGKCVGQLQRKFEKSMNTQV